MDFASLFLIVGSGAVVDTVATVRRGNEPIVPIIGGSLLLVLLGAIGRVTGSWNIVAAVAFLYLLASIFRNYSTFVEKKDTGVVSALTKK